MFPDIRLKNELMQTCNAGNAHDCMIVGLLDAASKNPMGKSELERACLRNDRFACEMGKHLK